MLARLRNGIYFVVAGGFFCAVCWGIFGNGADTDDVAELTEDQLDVDVSAGLGAIGVNSSAANPSGSHGEPSQLPFEISSNDSGDPQQTRFQDSAIRPISNATDEAGPLFDDPISGVNPMSRVGKQDQPVENIPSTQAQEPAWLTGKIEFE